MKLDIEQKILGFLKKHDKSISQRKLSQNLKISYPTILKWCVILKFKELIEIEDLGNTKLISLKEVK